MSSSRDKKAGARQVRPPRIPVPGVPPSVSYRWDIAEDRLLWGNGAARFFGIAGMARLKTGRAYADRLTGSPGASRAHAILFANETDEGFGVPYRAVYGFTRPDGSVLWVEDSGRWFAGRDGRPARAQGIVRPGAEPAPAFAGATEADFLTILARDFDGLRESGSTAALMVFATADTDAGADTELHHSLRKMVRIGDRTGLVGRMLVLFARSCPPDAAEEAARRIASVLTRETGQTVAATALRVPADARHPMAAIAAAERRLALPRDAAADSLTRALHALNSRNVAMARQPIVAAGTRTISLYEVLARVHNDEGGFEPTQDLVAALEAHGSIALLDHRILSLAADALARDPALVLAVNVAPRSLADPDWFRYAEVRLSRRPDIARRLVFEITEQADLAMLAHAHAPLAAIKDWGIRLAIDDFGMGRTSLRHLTALRADIVKIAGPFVQNLGHSLEDRQFVGALIDLSRQIGMQTVAEWVEDEAAAAFLEDRGVDFMQGRLFGGPALIETAPELAPQVLRRRSAL